ncbi:hypothetical protein SAMN04489712_101319 [Thermomonospora echinospora]|uniref:Lipoprotein n=1 Tax=Thermomonospora echinospora TaxID=1992 RepID=A0A1H5SSH0_9ACTN|nr:hypothetical protein [Thermomonospora echinospora]SEF52761.1 hypothetical protein SAMN04489712_101319 [Thermomonospora echinospora]
MGRPHNFRPDPGRARRAALRGALTAACGAALLLGGCSAGGSGQNAGGDDPPGVTVAGLEDLASKAGCTLQSQTKAEELRQGACQTSKGRYTLVTFTTEEGQGNWLREAKPWGGTYLVGPRWVAVGTEQTLQTLRQDLGGEIQAGDDHGQGGKHEDGNHGGHTPG